MLFYTFEEMKKDLRGVIEKTAKFLNKTLTEEQTAAMLDYLDIKNMRNNPMVYWNYFVILNYLSEMKLGTQKSFKKFLWDLADYEWNVLPSIIKMVMPKRFVIIIGRSSFKDIQLSLYKHLAMRGNLLQKAFFVQIFWLPWKPVSY